MPSSVIGGVAASVGGSLISGAIGKKSGDKAAKAQQEAADKSVEEQKRQYDLSRADLAPFRNTGVAANTKLSAMMGLGEFNRDAIGANIKSKFGALFDANKPTSGLGGPTLASTDAGKEALGRMFYQQKTDASPRSFSEGYGQSNYQTLTPEDYAKIGEFAALSPEQQFAAEELGLPEYRSLSEILTKYRRN